jgi:hypothetical protein
MRPLGVVSKKTMGDRKIANAILSCNLREACRLHTNVSHHRSALPARLPAITNARAQAWELAHRSPGVVITHLDRAEDPQNQRLEHNQSSGADAKREVYPKIEGDVWIAAQSFVDLQKQ